LKVDGGAQHSVILAKVPTTFMDTARRKLEEAEAKYERRQEERRRAASEKGRGGEEEEELDIDEL
jgi:hypothetical protein